MKIQKVLAIETSCDDTSVAIVNVEREVLAIKTANQDLVHKPFGGIVPEIAGRNHCENLVPLIDKLMADSTLKWQQIDGLAVTNRPGLVGSLLVGLVTAKSLALIHEKPFIGINHIEGHLWAPFLRDSEYQPEMFEFPFVSLAVSGGHTQLVLVEGLGRYCVLGRSIDDAAGEAFDKFAKMLGLGYPGGVQVDRLAAQGHPKAFEFPRPMLKVNSLNMSFSGLKTSAQNLLRKMTEEQIQESLADICASYQQAIVDVLVNKLSKAAQEADVSQICLTGGVSANSGLRTAVESLVKNEGWELRVPPPKYCTDNAAMIGLAGIMRLNSGEFSMQDLGPSPKSWPEDFGAAIE